MHFVKTRYAKLAKKAEIVRMSKTAYEALDAKVVAFVEETLTAANSFALHAKRQTVKAEDIDLVD